MEKPDVYAGFINRFSRLISQIWFSIIFESKQRKRNNDKKVALSEIFKIEEELIENIQEVMKLIQEYTLLRRSSDNEDNFSKEINLLFQLSKFIEAQLSILQFFSLIKSEKTLFIDSCFKRLNQSTLLNSTYGETKDLLNLLRAFALTIFLDESGKPREQPLLLQVSLQYPFLLHREEISFRSEIWYFMYSKSPFPEFIL
jgi:hypothetical protein